LNPAEIALAGLLHDIGYFAQWAGHCLPSEASGPEWTAEFTDLAQEAIPRPLLQTLWFVHNLPFLPEGLERSGIGRRILEFHGLLGPAKHPAAQAHQLAGHFPNLSGKEGPEVEQLPGRLVAIADTVGRNGRPSPSPAVLPLEELRPSRAFPQRGDDPQSPYPSAEVLASLWQGFCTAWGENRCSTPVGFVARAAWVLERFTWCLPAASQAVADVSFFDHAKVTAALAVCLSIAESQARAPFLLVAGELVGIQKYLFDLRQGTGGLARRLRARSFKVAAYVEMVSLTLLRRLGLPLTQRILFAGGKFVLILPNTPEVEQGIQEIRSEVARWVFDQSQGEVSISLAILPATAEELHDFATTFTKLGDQLRNARRRSGADVLLSSEGWCESAFLLPAVELAENEVRCESCRRRTANLAAVPPGELAVCSHCREEEQLGWQLPRARYVLYFAKKPVGFLAPGGSFLLMEADVPEDLGADLVIDLDGRGQGPGSLPIQGAFRSRHIPRDPKTAAAYEFSHLAFWGEGRELLACLKMDADNLGFIISQGVRPRLPEGNQGALSAVPGGSLARLAGLSRTLELFFGGYIEELLRERFSDVYLVYSGGDDLVAIGPWSRILDLAGEIREQFRRFTADNPVWSLSAGVAVINPHVPVLVAIAEADRLLEVSKNIVGAGILPYPPPEDVSAAGESPKKNRITVFETSIPWDEFGPMMAQAKRLTTWVRQGVVSTGQVRRLMYYAGLARQFLRTRDTQYLQYVPYLVRDLRRTWSERTTEHQEAKHWAAQCTLPGSLEILKAWFICHYALYASRSAE
jgi:CRISPR-associated protein Csm1